MAHKPRIFVGSSSKSQDVAASIANGLREVAHPMPWWELSSGLTRATLENLDAMARQVEFAVLVVGPDDMRDRGQGAAPVPRDNVVFELGLFIGALGRDRTFAVRPRGKSLDLPTDLQGIHLAEYAPVPDDPKEPHDRNVLLKEAVQGAVATIKEKLAPRLPPIADIVKVYPQRRFVTPLEWNEFIRGTQHQLWLYGIAEWGYAEDQATMKTFKEVPKECEIRVLLLDPRSQRVAEVAEHDEGRTSLLRGRIDDALKRFSKMRELSGQHVKLRVYTSQPQISIVRSDGRALVTTYIRPLPGNDSPTLEVRQRTEEGLFERYAEHFEKEWREARDWS